MTGMSESRAETPQSSEYKKLASGVLQFETGSAGVSGVALQSLAEPSHDSAVRISAADLFPSGGSCKQCARNE